MSAAGRVIKVTDFEHRLMINCLRKARNEYIEQGMPTEDVSKLMVKVLEAPSKKQRSENETR